MTLIFEKTKLIYEQRKGVALLKRPTVISTEAPTCRDEVEKSIKKQISRLASGSLEMTFRTLFNRAKGCLKC
jgi:hypothetical protein